MKNKCFNAAMLYLGNENKFAQKLKKFWNDFDKILG